MIKQTFLALAALVAVGCGSDPASIDTSSNQGRIRSMKLSPLDFNEAAATAVNNMFKSKVFSNYLRQYEANNTDMPLLMLGKIVNNTSQTVNMPVLTERITEALMNAELVQVTTAAAGDGQLRDASSAEIRDLEYDENFDQSTVQKRGTLKAPNLSLSGAIIQQQATVGRTTEVTYFITLTLTDNRNGVAVWKGTQEIGRQETKPLIGF